MLKKDNEKIGKNTPENYKYLVVYYDYLKEKHKSIDLKIQNFYNSFKDEELKKMKIQRLHLKDEMTYYQNLIEES